jgi:2-polyprenyl-3-methyl-5-hydroxy-6-metoxy-1,4-benzoquinol methylase
VSARDAVAVTVPVSDHYERLLGPIYSWMVGDLEAACARADAELDAIGLPAMASGTALDLGAGFGMHSLPLARRGYRVIALDTCEPLLQELRSRAGTLSNDTVNADLLDLRAHVAQPAAVILCMGDTLTHLPDAAALDRLFVDVAAVLSPGGLFVATFRDYVSTPLQADARFILVRGDENRILTCFLEYSADTVQVHDVLHERVASHWQLRLGSYSKLRLAPEAVVKALSSHGFSVHREAGISGKVRVIARR